MKVIIYLASDEPTASRNFFDLLEVRSDVKTDKVASSVLEDRLGDLYPAPRSKTQFEEIDPSESTNVTVELVAHGNPRRPTEILTYSNKISVDIGDRHKMYLNPDADPLNYKGYKGVNADELARFFKRFAFTGHYKFARLTLFCCASDRFALELSGIMRSILITAYKERIFIDNKTGDAKCIDGLKENEIPSKEQLANSRLAVPQIFHDGIDQTNNAEFKFEAKREEKQAVDKPFSFGTFEEILNDTLDTSSRKTIPPTQPTALFKEKQSTTSVDKPLSQRYTQNKTAADSISQKNAESDPPLPPRKTN